MKASQLIAKLQEFPPDKPCVVLHTIEDEDGWVTNRSYYGLNIVEQQDKIVLNME